MFLFISCYAAMSRQIVFACGTDNMIKVTLCFLITNVRGYMVDFVSS
jgi:hypothetical protein